MTDMVKKMKVVVAVVVDSDGDSRCHCDIVSRYETEKECVAAVRQEVTDNYMAEFEFPEAHKLITCVIEIQAPRNDCVHLTASLPGDDAKDFSVTVS
jgi:hypothetical protein